MNVIKRDGREVVFEKDKIKNAILKAFKAQYGDIDSDACDCAEKIAQEIENINKT